MDLEYKVTSEDLQILSNALNINSKCTSQLRWPEGFVNNGIKSISSINSPTECDVRMAAKGSITLRFVAGSNGNAPLYCDWGDGSMQRIYDQGSAAAYNLAATHQYTDAGDYTIRIYCPTTTTYNLGKDKYSFFNLDSSSSKSSTTPQPLAVRIGSQVRVLSANCFKGCTNLKFVSIPETVTTINANAFDSVSGCTLFCSKVWNPSGGSTGFLFCNNLIYNQNLPIQSSFSGTTSAIASLNYLVLPPCQTYVESSSFSYTNLSFAPGIQNIEWVNLFHTALENIFIYDLKEWFDVTQNEYLDYNTSNPDINQGYNFYIQNQLCKTLWTPIDISHIKDYSFKNCLSIETICLSNQIISIGHESFACPNLKQLYCFSATPPTLSDDSFTLKNRTNVLDNATIYILDSYESDYKNDATWSQWSSNMQTISAQDTIIPWYITSDNIDLIYS